MQKLAMHAHPRAAPFILPTVYFLRKYKHLKFFTGNIKRALLGIEA